MRPPFRFLIYLGVGLALLTVAASWIVEKTSRRWFERDVALRAELAVSGVRGELVRAWRSGDAVAIRQLLETVTRDERILASIACAPDATPVAVTQDYPARLGCSALAPRVRASVTTPAAEWRTHASRERLGGSSVYISVHPLLDGAEPLGYVGLIHDMAFADRREASGRRFTLLLFGCFGALAASVTLLVARATRRRWFAELEAAARGEAARPELLGVLRDLRELVRDLNDAGAPGERAWSADRLRQTLTRHLHGERVIVVANREPYIHERDGEGGVRVVHPASGLVTALEPVMRACSGVWVAHGSGSADFDTTDGEGRVWVPPGEQAYQIRRVRLAPEEEQGYYYGFANEGLWPLCHVAHTRPTFRGDDFRFYEEVNRRFADAVVAESVVEDPIVLVQDYHFALAPAMIRARLPRATILTFWHIPWPNAERFETCPYARRLLEGLLGSSIVGFHTQAHCNNFLETVDRALEARIDRERFSVIAGGRPTLVRPYPISIEWPNHWADDSPSVEECRAGVRAELGLAPDVQLGVGVDRLDYTKGIEERLLAVERLFERFPELRRRFTFVQLAAPSRSVIPAYRELAASVDAIAERIQVRFGDAGWRPVVLLRAHHEPPTVFRYYRAADVCYVSSLHDGMNLVAKEFVASRDDEAGVLVLSRFTGAARELTDALVVNPYDLDEASGALARALSMSRAEQRERMHAMRSLVSHFNVYRWAGRMLIDAAQLRSMLRRTSRRRDAGEALA